MPRKPRTALVETLARPADLPGQAAEDPTLIAKVVDEINVAYEQGGLATLRNVGRIVLASMFGNRIDDFLATEKDHVSYRALAKHPGLRISASSLWYAVAIEDNFHVLGDLAHELPASYHRLLIHVKDKGHRLALAKRVVDEDLTVLQLDAAIKALAPPADPDTPKRGRPALPLAIKDFNRVNSAIESLPDTSFEGLADEDGHALLEKARTAQGALAAWIAGLEAELTRRAG